MNLTCVTAFQGAFRERLESFLQQMMLLAYVYVATPLDPCVALHSTLQDLPLLASIDGA